MRKALVLGLSALVLASGTVPSEARFRFRGGGYSTSRSAPAVSPGLAVMPVISLRGTREGAGYPPSPATGGRPIGAMSAEALPFTEERTVTIARPFPAPVPAAAAPKKDDGPWCASGRIAGSGAGFCVIN